MDLLGISGGVLGAFGTAVHSQGLAGPLPPLPPTWGPRGRRLRTAGLHGAPPHEDPARETRRADFPGR